MAQQYTIQNGDTLFNLALKYYGDGNLWGKIADANPGLNPNDLPLGRQITIP